jgi:hypothetical protein
MDLHSGERLRSHVDPSSNTSRFLESDLADTLSPNDAISNRPFMLRINSLTFVGYPTQVKEVSSAESQGSSSAYFAPWLR